jgi:excisionase family DNA binding protein
MRVTRKPLEGLRVMSFEPLALSPRDAATMLAVSRRTVSNLIRLKKLVARKHGKRTLVDYESVKAFYAGLPEKIDHAPLVFGERAHARPRSRPRRKQR